MDLAASMSLYSKAHKLDGRTEFQGLLISIENGVGSVRRGVDKKTGKPWETHMRNAYGYIRLTEGVDGDHVDCFLGPHPNARYAYVIHQNNPNTGKYDEDKVMLGFNSATAAKAAYNVHYDQPWKFYDSMDEIPMDEFKRKVLDTKQRPKVIKAKSMYAGGPGSGCNPAAGHCGRPSSSEDAATEVHVRQRMEDTGAVTKLGKYEANLYHASNDGELNTHSTRGVFLSPDKNAIAEFGSQITQWHVAGQNAVDFASAWDMFRYLLGPEGPTEFDKIAYKKDAAHGPGMFPVDKSSSEYIEGLKALETRAAASARAKGFDVIVSPFKRGADQVWVLDSSKVTRSK